MRAAYLMGFVCCFSCFSGSATQALPLPTTEDFDTAIKKCVVAEQLAIRSDLVDAISNIYSAQRPDGAPSFKTAAEFVVLMPKELKLEAYRLFRQCITP